MVDQPPHRRPARGAAVTRITTKPLVLRVVRATRQHVIGSDSKTEYVALYWEGGEIGVDMAPASSAASSPRYEACFSRSGWWQTLCGLDAANQGFGWTSDPEQVGCAECRRLIADGEHLRRKVHEVLKPRKK